MKDTDLNTPEERIAWFCAHFQVTPPELEYDKEQSGGLLLTDSLLRWFELEGVSIDWVVSGGVAGMASTFRDKYRIDPSTYEAMRIIRQLSEEEQKIMLEALEAQNRGELSMDEALAGAKEKIDALRAA